MKVSVVIPAYNAESYISSAIKSAYVSDDNLQTEIIVVDDGSTDNTVNEITKTAKGNANVHILTQENSGAMAARAKGAMAASGDYVLFCDADDTLATENLKYFAEYAYEHQLDILVGCSHDYSGDRSVDFIQYNKVEGNISSITFIENILKSKIIFGPACKMFKRNLLTHNVFDFPADIVFNEDLYMNIAIAKHADKIYVLRDLVIYNHLTDNTNSVCHTRKQSEEQWLRLFSIIKDNIADIKGFDKNAYCTFVCDRLRTNYFNKGLIFSNSKEVKNILDSYISKPGIRELVTLYQLRFPILVKLYNLIFTFRKKVRLKI